MEKNGQIEIRVSGKIGNVDINPDNFDIREIISILENVDDLLYNGDKKNRPLISYDIQEGSVRNIFKTGIQYIVSFNASLKLYLKLQLFTNASKQLSIKLLYF